VLIGGQIFNQDSPTGQVILTSLDGCDSILNVMYSIEAVEFDATVFDASCGDENGFIVINSATSEGPYSYALDFTETGTFEIGDTIFGISPGDHNITFITIGMDLCTDMLDFTIEEADDFTIDIPAFAAIDEGGSFSLDIPEIDGFDITWSPPTGISCTDCSNPEFNPTETTQYFVTVSDGANCSAVDSILIRVELNFDTYIPNVFTPNQDGLNDVFLIFSESDINYDLWIYDRWGNRVFEGLDLITNDTSTGWDGTFNSSQVSQGVYAYKALLQIEEGEEPVLISGTITIAR
jgi:gliding motility-associated-like protein